jgi:fatty acid desaturase
MAQTWQGGRPISTAELRDLSRRRPPRATLAIARQWAVMGFAAAGAVWWGRWYGYIPAVVVIATRQHALAVLMHDGAHGSLYARRAVNDLVSDLFLAFPLFISTTLYRRHHLEHHRYLNSERDPDLDPAALGRTPRQWAWLFAGDVTGLNLLKTVDSLDQFSLLPVLRGNRAVARAMGRPRLILFLAYLAALAVILSVTGAWLDYLLLWILPSLTALSMILRVRAVAEHVGCAPDDGVGGTRTVLAGPLERMLFAPCGINYHLAHHLYPSIPFCNLSMLHRQLMKHPEIRAQARISGSYLFGKTSVLRHIAEARRDATLIGAQS